MKNNLLNSFIRTFLILTFLVSYSLLNKSLGQSVELLSNGNFATSNSGWSATGDFYYNSNFSTCLSCPGYAFLSTPTGGTAANLAGDISQTITIPSSATSATLSFYTYIGTLQTSSAIDFLQCYFIYGTFQTYQIGVLTNLDYTSGYVQHTYSIPSSLFGTPLTLYFEGSTDNTSLGTKFRLDDASLSYVPGAGCSPITNFNLVSQTVTITAPSQASFSILPSGTTPNYQWQLSSDGGSSWASVPNSGPYSGISTSTLTINPTSFSMNGFMYRCYLNNNCSSGYSNWGTLSVNQSCTPPAAPILISPTVISSTQIDLNWNTVSGATSYDVYYTSGSCPWNNGSLYSNTPSTSISILGLIPGTIYKFVVVAKNSSTCASGNSNCQSATTQFNLNIQCELLWDYSFPQPTAEPLGVAADGVARIYLKISKVNSSGPTISNVNITLSDNLSSIGSRILGKVMRATNTTSYDLEANSANATTVSNNISGQSDYWFWYVAPDDFQRSGSNDFVNLERFVNANIIVNFSDGSVSNTIKTIEIVRPPLMMVHGIWGENTSWDRFSNNFNLFKDDTRYVVRKAIKLNSNFGHFTENARYLLGVSPNSLSGLSPNSNRFNNSIVGLIYDLRFNHHFACNQLYYLSHSMGGSIVRTINHDFAPLLFNGFDQYLCYGKSFINKAITLDTPHDGAFLPNIATAITPGLNSLLTYRFSFDPTEFDYLNNLMSNTPYKVFQVTPSPNIGNWIETTPAINDLRTIGGKYFSSDFNIPTHLICGNTLGGFSADNFPLVTALSSEELIYAEYIDVLLIQLKAITFNPAKRQSIENIQNIVNIPRRILKTLDYFSSEALNQAGTFIGDFVVSQHSQLADISPQAQNVDVISGITHFSGLNFIAPSVISDLSVGNRVDDLLHSSVQSNLYGFIPGRHSSLRTGLPDANSSKIIINRHNVGDFQFNLLNPGVALYIGDSIHTTINIIDTANYDYTWSSFQHRNYYNYTSTINSAYIIYPNSIDSNLYFVAAVYDYPDSTVFVWDELIFNITPNYSCSSFLLPNLEDTLYIRFGEEKNLNFQAVYGIDTINLNDIQNNITSVISDTSIIQYNSILKTIKGESIGITHVTFFYQGFYLMVTVVVDDTLIHIPQIALPVAMNFTNDTIVCKNTVMNFIVQGATNYMWITPIGIDSLSGSSLSISVQTSGYYGVYGYDAFGNYGSSTIYINIDSLPVAPSVIVNGNSTFCFGNSTQLYFIDSICKNCIYTWSDGSNSDSITISQSGTYFITVENNCGIANSDSTFINVINNPTPIISGSLSICEGHSTTLDAGVGFLSYLWSTSDSSQLITTSLADTFVVTVVDSNGCSGSSSPTIVNVISNPNPIITGPNSVCSYSNGVVYSIPNTGDTIQWVVTGAISFSGQGTDSILVNWASTSGNINVSQINSITGCISDTNLFVTVSSVLNPIINPSGTIQICQGNNVILDASAGYNSYLWSNGDTTQTISVSTAGIYFVSVTSNGCYGSSSIPASIFINLPQNLLPVSLIADTMYSPYNQQNYWFVVGNTNPIDSGIYYVCRQDTNYYVVGIDVNGCVALSDIVNCNPTNINGISNSEIQVYPNPSNGRFNIRIDKNIKECWINIYNILNQNVYQLELKNISFLFTKDFDLKMPSGSYILILQYDGGSIEKTLIIK